jgi:hypothetical protein
VSADQVTHAVPLTPPGPLWSQREYVAALALGIGFAAHRAGDLDQWFHYAFPGDVGCTSVRVGVDGAKQHVVHGFLRAAGWPQKMRAAVESAS